MKTIPKELSGTHFCAKHNRLRTPGKVKKHDRRCDTCKDHWANAAALGLVT